MTIPSSALARVRPVRRAGRAIGILTAGLVAAGLGFPLAAPAHADETGESQEFEPTGTPVAGEERAADAPLLEPGMYVTEVSAASPLHYKVRAEPGSTVRVSATSQPLGGTDGTEVTLLAGDDECGSSEAERKGNDILDVNPLMASWAAHLVGDGDDACANVTELDIRVEQLPPFDADRASHALRAELLVLVEPPLQTTPRDLPPPTAETNTEVDPPEPAPGVSPVDGSFSFANAPTLEPGSYTDTIATGQSKVYKVQATWGQAPAFAARFDPPDLTVPPGTQATVRAFAPDRAEVPRQRSRSTENHQGGISSGPTTLGFVLPEVAFRNREEGHPSVSLAGHYYFVVQAGNTPGDPTIEAPIELTVGTAGDPVEAPDYVNDSPSSSDNGASGGENGADSSGNEESANGASEGGHDEGTEAADDDRDSSGEGDEDASDDETDQVATDNGDDHTYTLILGAAVAVFVLAAMSLIGLTVASRKRRAEPPMSGYGT